MGEHTSISWTNATWTPIRARNKATGKQGHYCQKISPGCANCYSASMNAWRGNGVPYAVDKFDQVELYLDEKALLEPLKWKKPRMIFVCSMTDLFADFVPDEWIDKVFSMMSLCPQHTFQVLTKRPKRMLAYMTEMRSEGWTQGYIALAFGRPARFFPRAFKELPLNNEARMPWPLPNVWLGTSVENQKCAEERIPYLMDTPAAIRFLSCEPLLGPINLGRLEYMDGEPEHHDDGSHTVCGYCIDALEGTAYDDENGELSTAPDGEVPLLGKIHWVIVGGESGVKARPMLSRWADGLREQCEDSGTKFFFKQAGEYIDAGHEEFGRLPAGPLKYLHSDGSEWPAGKVPFEEDADVNVVKRVGRKRAGDTLYGKVYHEFPA